MSLWHVEKTEAKSVWENMMPAGENWYYMWKSNWDRIVKWIVRDSCHLALYTVVQTVAKKHLE